MTTPLDDLDSPIPHEDDTRHNLRAVRSTLTEVRSMHVAAVVAREQDAADRKKLWWKVGGASVPLIITALAFSARMLFAVGGLDEQARAQRADVARVLIVVERLDRAGVGVDARLGEVERANTSTRDGLRALEQKMWDARSRRPEERP